MRISRLSLLVAIIVINLAAFPETGRGTDVIGLVVDSVSGMPLPGVSVVIVGTGDSTLTDGVGRYYFPNVAPGRYAILIGRAQYQPRILPLVGIGVPAYICGDPNGDGQANVGDAVYIISYVFRGGPSPNPLAAGDANGDGICNIGDVVYLVNYIFRGGVPPVCL